MVSPPTATAARWRNCSAAATISARPWWPRAQRLSTGSTSAVATGTPTADRRPKRACDEWGSGAARVGWRGPGSTGTLAAPVRHNPAATGTHPLPDVSFDSLAVTPHWSSSLCCSGLCWSLRSSRPPCATPWRTATTPWWSARPPPGRSPPNGGSASCNTPGPSSRTTPWPCIVWRRLNCRSAVPWPSNRSAAAPGNRQVAARRSTARAPPQSAPGRERNRAAAACPPDGRGVGGRANHSPPGCSDALMQ
jgi:hypothetical protein